MVRKLTEEQKQDLFVAMIDEVSDMTAKDIVRTYLWPEPDDDETFDALYERYFDEEELNRPAEEEEDAESGDDPTL